MRFFEYIKHVWLSWWRSKTAAGQKKRRLSVSLKDVSSLDGVQTRLDDAYHSQTTYCFLSECALISCGHVQTHASWRSEVTQTSSEPLHRPPTPPPPPLCRGMGCRWWIAFSGRCVRARHSHKLSLNDSLYRSSPCLQEKKYWGWLSMSCTLPELYPPCCSA